MKRSVKFKNATTRPNKRARLTHGNETTVEIGVQSGAVYYEDPELGMCYSKPMEITCTNKEETQCVSLVGLYDLFIDGQRVGRGLTQTEILERVNAGNYGVEAVACINVSCEGAPTKTNCLELTGKWNVEINDIRIVDNADQDRILAVLEKNPWIRAELCKIKCTPSGEWVFNASDISGRTFAVGSSIRWIVRVNDVNEDVHYDDTIIRFHSDRVECGYSTGLLNTVVNRADSQDPWSADAIFRAVQANYSIKNGMVVDYTPEGWFNNSYTYCSNNDLMVRSVIYATNMYAFDRSTYTYTGGYSLSFSNMTPIVQLRMVKGRLSDNRTIYDGTSTTLTPFTWDPSAQTKEVAELMMLNHFKAELENLGFECEIIESERKNIPPAYNGGPNTSLHDLRINASFPFLLTPSEQWEGTAAHPENKNIDNGWDLNSVGINVTGQNGTGGAGPGDINGCRFGYMPADEVGVSIKLRGLNDETPVGSSIGRLIYNENSASYTMVRVADEGLVLEEGQIDMCDLFPHNAGEDNRMFTCGWYEIEEPEPM